MREQSAADGDLAAQHGSEPKLKHKGIQKLPCQHREGERKGEEMDHHLPAACEPLGRMHAPPGANTLPISRRGTAKLFHMNLLIPLQCLEGFCSSMHTWTHTHTHAQAPRLHLEAIQGWKMLPKRVTGSGTHECLGTGGSQGNYLAAATRGRQEMMKSHLKLDFRNNLLPFFSLP